MATKDGCWWSSPLHVRLGLMLPPCTGNSKWTPVATRSGWQWNPDGGTWHLVALWTAQILCAWMIWETQNVFFMDIWLNPGIWRCSIPHENTSKTGKLWVRMYSNMWLSSLSSLKALLKEQHQLRSTSSSCLILRYDQFFDCISLQFYTVGDTIQCSKWKSFTLVVYPMLFAVGHATSSTLPKILLSSTQKNFWSTWKCFHQCLDYTAKVYTKSQFCDHVGGSFALLNQLP